MPEDNTTRCPGDSAERRVAILTERWGDAGSEAQRFVRQVAGVLALEADVDVVCTTGRERRSVADGVFTVHQLAARSWRNTLRRDLLVRALAVDDPPPAVGGHASPGTLGSGPPRSGPALSSGADEWFRRHDEEIVAQATAHLREIDPNLLVVAGLAHFGLAEALTASWPDVPVVVLPLLEEPGLLRLSPAAQLIARADAVLVASPDEERLLRPTIPSGSLQKLHDVGATVTISGGARRESVTALADQDYLAVLCDTPGTSEAAVGPYIRMLSACFPRNPVAALHRDRVAVWREGGCQEQLAPASSPADLGRVLAWARLTVDLRSHSLYAGGSLESLRYGTPIVVPAGGRAHQHAALGNGGLWFRDLAEMAGAVGGALDPTLREHLSTAGRIYADSRYGSTARFLDRVRSACAFGRQIPTEASEDDVTSSPVTS